MSNRETYKQYYLNKGLSPVHVQGILPNMGDESGFSPNPSGPNDGGMSYGLFQHYGPRRDALFRHAGTSSPTWEQQMDFALTEPEMQAYLANDYANVGDAAVGFLDNFEKPAKKHRDARAAKYRREYGHWQPDGQTVPAAAIAGDPSVYSGSIAPVSALPPGGSPMYPQLTPPPAPPPMAQMPQLSPMQQALQDPMLMTGLGLLSSAVSGAPFGQALQGGMMGGYGNALAMQELQQKQLDRDYSHKQALWEFQNQQARDKWKYDTAQADEAAADAEAARNAEVAGITPADYAYFKTTGEMPEQAATVSVPGNLPQDLATEVQTGNLEPAEAIKIAETRKRETEAAVKGARKEYRGDVSGPAFRLQVWDEVKEMNPADQNAIEDQRLGKAWAKAVLPKESVMAGDTGELSEAGENIASSFMNYWTDGTGALSEDKKRKLLQDIRLLAMGAQDATVQTWGNAQNAAMRNTLIPQGRMDDVVGRLPKLFEPSSQEWMRDPATAQSDTWFSPTPDVSGAVPGDAMMPGAGYNVAPPSGVPATATRIFDKDTATHKWYDPVTQEWYAED